MRGQTSKELASSVVSSRVNFFLTHELSLKVLVLVKWSKVLKALSQGNSKHIFGKSVKRAFQKCRCEGGGGVCGHSVIMHNILNMKKQGES